MASTLQLSGGSRAVAGHRSAAAQRSQRATATPLLHRSSPVAVGAAARPLHLQRQQQQQRHGGRLAGRVPRSVATTVVSDAPPAADAAEGALAVDDDALAAAADAQPINWLRQWYPIAVLADLDPSRPTPARILGRRIVIWRAAAGGGKGGDGKGDGAGKAEWSALEDRCPHRLAPLSEGRVDPKSGNLMCSYHGWEFDAGGRCTAIPQLGADPRGAAAATASGRSCAARLPTREAQGLLWVWPDASPEGAAAAAAAPIAALIPEDDTDGGVTSDGSVTSSSGDYEARTGWYLRDAPVSLETTMENVLDPCHAPFAHHGVQGRRENERGTAILPLSPPTAAGFACEQQGSRPNGAPIRGRFEFVAPCLIKYDFPALGRIMAVYAVPTEPGWTRMIARFYRRKTPGASAMKFPLPLRLLLGAMEALEANTVLGHALVRNAVLDGDNYLLHVQERALLEEAEAEAAAAAAKAAKEGGDAAAAARAAADDAWRRRYFLPGRSDTGVKMWRAWLGGFGRDLPVLPKRLSDLPPLMTRREALDRLSQHTRHCPSCQRALKRIDFALPLVAAAAVALLAAAAYAALFAGGAPALSARALGVAAGAAVLAFVHARLSSFRELFVFRDYVHADKH